MAASSGLLGDTKQKMDSLIIYKQLIQRTNNILPNGAKTWTKRLEFAQMRKKTGSLWDKMLQQIKRAKPFMQVN